MNGFSTNRQWRTPAVMRAAASLTVLLLCLAVTGCAEREALYVDIRTVIPVPDIAPRRIQALHVAVTPFEDRRDSRRTGTLYGVFGQELPVAVSGGNLAEQITLTLIDYYQRREGWITWIDKPAIATPAPTPDIKLGGEVLTWLIEVHDYLVTTKVALTTRVNLELVRTADGQKFAVDIQERTKHWLVGFDEEEIDVLLSKHLHGTAEKFLKKARQEGWPVQPAK